MVLFSRIFESSLIFRSWSRDYNEVKREKSMDLSLNISPFIEARGGSRIDNYIKFGSEGGVCGRIHGQHFLCHVADHHTYLLLHESFVVLAMVRSQAFE